MYNTRQEIEKVYKELNTLLESVDIKVEIFDFSFFLPIHSNSVKDKFNLEILVYGEKSKVLSYKNDLRAVNEQLKVDWQRFNLSENNEFHDFKSYNSGAFKGSETSSSLSFQNLNIQNVIVPKSDSDEKLVKEIVNPKNKLNRYGKSLVVLSREWSNTQVNSYVFLSGVITDKHQEKKDEILQILRNFIVNETIHLGEINNNYLSDYKRKVSAYKHSVKSEFVKLKNSIDDLEFLTNEKDFTSFDKKIELIQNKVLIVNQLLVYTYGFKSDRDVFDELSNLSDTLEFFKNVFGSNHEIQILEDESFGRNYLIKHKNLEWKKSIFLLFWNLISNSIKHSSVDCPTEIKIKFQSDIDKVIVQFINPIDSIPDSDKFCPIKYLKDPNIEYVKTEDGGLKIIKDIFSKSEIYLWNSETQYFKNNEKPFIKISLVL